MEADKRVSVIPVPAWPMVSIHHDDLSVRLAEERQRRPLPWPRRRSQGSRSRSASRPQVPLWLNAFGATLGCYAQRSYW
jgi:hypothetical protein